MFEALICRPWEPTGPCWASCTTPSLPSEDLIRSLLFCSSSIEGLSWFFVVNKWEPQRGSLSRSEGGERNVAKRGHGRPCGEQPLDETYGNCAQGKETSRLRRDFRCSRLWTSRHCRTGPQSVSLFSSLSVEFFYYFYFYNLILIK